MWLPAHLADVESDMSAVHGIKDTDDLPAPKWFAYAWRLPHYRGVMRDRVLAWQREQGDAPSAPEQPYGGQAAPAHGPTHRTPQPVTEAVLSDPVMSKIFSFG